VHTSAIYPSKLSEQQFNLVSDATSLGLSMEYFYNNCIFLLKAFKYDLLKVKSLPKFRLQIKNANEFLVKIPLFVEVRNGILSAVHQRDATQQ